MHFQQHGAANELLDGQSQKKARSTTEDKLPDKFLCSSNKQELALAPQEHRHIVEFVELQEHPTPVTQENKVDGSEHHSIAWA